MLTTKLQYYELTVDEITAQVTITADIIPQISHDSQVMPLRLTLPSSVENDSNRMRSARSRISTHSDPISWIMRLCSVVPVDTQYQSRRTKREMFQHDYFRRNCSACYIFLQYALHGSAPTTEFIHQPLPLKLALSREMTCACRAEWEASSIASRAT
jgi:hypothetical protein